MSKLLNPLLSQDARGSVAGVQFSRNRSGCFGSRKSTSNRKQGDVATAQRALLKLAHSAWSAIGTDLQTQWEAHAPATMTGRNAFIGAQIRNFTYNGPVLSLNPLEGPIAGRIRNMRAQMQAAPMPPLRIQWNFKFNEDDVLLFYFKPPPGPHLVHTRKYKFMDYAYPIDIWKILYPAPIWPFGAIRVIHWDYKRGKLIGDHRGLLIGSAWTQITE